MAWMGPLIMGAATLGGAALSYHGAKKANKQTKQSADEQMAFQERMSSTAVQRQMQDMEAAGINPVFSGKYGGASAPSGASYDAQNEYEGAPTAVASAIALKRMKAELDNLHETNTNLKANNLQIASQTELNVASAKKLAAETDMLAYQRMREKVIKPVYDVAGNVVAGGVATAKEVYERWRDPRGKVFNANANPFDKFGRKVGQTIYDWTHPEGGSYSKAWQKYMPKGYKR